jgi:hypothetical protein
MLLRFAIVASLLHSNLAAMPALVSQFTEKHCVSCHDADVQKGGFNLTAAGEDFEAWQKVLKRVQKGDMPPAKKPQPTAEERAAFVAGLLPELLKVDEAAVAKEGRVQGRRLTRTEYEHTLHDLLGIDIPLKTLLPEDQATYGFETVADGQQLSQHQLARYLDVADLALKEAFDRALEKERPYVAHHTPEQLAMRRSGNYRGPDLRDGRSISWPITLQFFGRMFATEVPRQGWYRITLRNVAAVNPDSSGVVWGTLRSGECSSSAPMLSLVGLVEATATPRDLVYEAWLEDSDELELKPNDARLKRAQTGATGGSVSFKGRDLAKDGYQGIAHTGIDVERIHPYANDEEVRRRLLGKEKIHDDQAVEEQRLLEFVRAFAERAFRRPVTADDAAAYTELALEERKLGATVSKALRAAYRAVLCSPRFLTFVEEPGELGDYQIASRLSYGLWVSMPDAELLQAAADGKLKQADGLRAQVLRMMGDAKFQRFIVSYTDQWLKLSQIDFTSPDGRRYNFDPVLQESMLQETRRYFAHLLKEDLSVTHLIDSDFAILNERLAAHYGAMPKAPETKSKKKKKAPVPQVKGWPVDLTKAGEGYQLVKLPSDSRRGGLMTQAAILKVTADGTSTSPVVRGVFVNERLLGQHVPPPPPNIPAIEPDIRGAKSIRDQLAKHRSDESCAACHQTIDPPGFALENYDPIGGWRWQYGSKGVAVDASGTTAEGLAFADLAAWKALYVKQGRSLARGFVDHFLTYSTGAPLRLSDEAAVDAILSKTAGSYGLRSLITESILSRTFLHK